MSSSGERPNKPIADDGSGPTMGRRWLLLLLLLLLRMARQQWGHSTSLPLLNAEKK